MKHTPGPWQTAGWGITTSESDYEKRKHIARVPSDYERNKNNLWLIAAAPDMYEALANLENDDGSIPESIWQMRNDALKKARGEQ